MRNRKIVKYEQTVYRNLRIIILSFIITYFSRSCTYTYEDTTNRHNVLHSVIMVMYSRQPTNKDRDAKSGTIYDGSGALAYN